MYFAFKVYNTVEYKYTKGRINIAFLLVKGGVKRDSLTGMRWAKGFMTERI